MGRILAGVVCVCWLLAAGGAAEAAEDLRDDTPIALTADEVVYDRELGVIKASGHVEVSQANRVLMADPLLLCAMVLIAATFTLRHARRGGTTFIIAGGVLTGFVLYFFSDVVIALGLSDSIPIALAAWTPSGVTMLLGLAMLLHLEDG